MAVRLPVVSVFVLCMWLVPPLHAIDDVRIQRSVFLLGPTGVGKSWLGNKLSNAKPFKSSAKSTSVTVKVAWHNSATKLFRQVFQGQTKEQDHLLDLKVFDTPGLGDTEGRSTQFLDDIITDIQHEKPHGIIIVVQNTRDTSEFRLSMAALAECLGEATLQQTRRIALVVNKLPTSATMEEDEVEDTTQHLVQLIQDKLRSVSELLNLERDFYLAQVVGIQMDSSTSVDQLRNIIASMPDSRIDTSGIRTFTQVKQDGIDALKSVEGKKAATERRDRDLEVKVHNIQEELHYYANSLGGGAAVAGLGVATLGAGVVAFIPGLNVVAATAAVLGGYNTMMKISLEGKLKNAKKELSDFRALGTQGMAETELARLTKFKNRIDRLQQEIDSKGPSKKHDEF